MFEVFDAGSLVRADAIAHACIHFVLANPVVEVLRYAPDLRDNGLNGGPQGWVLAAVSSTM